MPVPREKHGNEPTEEELCEFLDKADDEMNRFADFLLDWWLEETGRK